MNRKVLNKDVQVVGDEVVITESVETRMDYNQLELRLRDVNMQKTRIKEQNNRLVEDYNRLLQVEAELNGLIGQLNISDGVAEL